MRISSLNLKAWRSAVLSTRALLLLLVLLLVLTVLQACTSLSDRHALAQRLTAGAGWTSRVDTTGEFQIAVSAPAGRKGSTLVAYLEGDGRAYLAADTASTDPTPGDPLALRMALADRRPGPLVYLARPCQYTVGPDRRNCSNRFWTSHRYAPAIIAAMGEALDQEKQRAGASRLILIGYSGGGALAVLLAQRRSDVAALVTVAANLDLAYWTSRDGLAPLSGSIDPASRAAAIRDVPQVHLAGRRDRVVGPDVTRAYLRHYQARKDFEDSLIGEFDFDHVCCWAERWPDILALRAVQSVFAVENRQP